MSHEIARRATAQFSKYEGSPLAEDVEGSRPYEATAGPGATGSAALPHAPKGFKALGRRRTFAEGEQHFHNRNRTWRIADSEESMGDVGLVVNLLADLAPAGIIPLAFGMKGTGYVPAALLLLLFAAAASYMMYLISRTIEISGERSFDKIWEKVLGRRTMWVPLLVVVLVCFGCCLAYACFFGDLFAGALPGMGLTWATRTNCILLLGAFPLLPLCMLKDLSALAPTSFGALIAVFYTIFMMIYRWMDSSYALGGKYYGTSTYEAPRDGGHVWAFGMPSLLLVNGLAVAFLSHYNGCKYYREFQAHTPGKFGNRILIAFGSVALLFVASMMLGFATFGLKSQGTILNNYSETDTMANIARIGMGLANVFSFPLMFSGLREAVVALLKVVLPSAEDSFDMVYFQNTLSALMLALITVVAVLVIDASVVVGLVGSICGSLIIYVIPSLLYDAACARFSTGSKGQCERALAVTLGFLGVFLAVAGAWATLFL